MKRVLLVLALATMALATTALAAPPEKWLEAYNRGVTAVNGAKYKAGADALVQAIAERPTEGTSIRSGNQIIAVYTPHFFLGIAKFNLGEVDAALREWRISEEQGAISRTEYYSNLKDWVARAQTEKQRNAQSAASAPKKSADAAISRAVALQADALSAGGDRTESYRNALRKLQEALSQYHKAGTDIDAYKTAENTATQAINLFTAAADEAKKLKAAQAARPAPVRQHPQPVPVQQKPAAPVVQTPPPAPVKSEAEVAAQIAVQTYSRDAKGEDAKEAEALRNQLASAKNDADFLRITRTANEKAAAMARRIAEANAPKPIAPAQIIPPSNPVTPQPRNFDYDLRSAYRAYASGDLATAEQQLTRALGEGAGAEAYLLRGCARYTRAMLSRTPDALLSGAMADFKAALARDRGLKLDPRAFSPKLVAYFEQVRNGR